MNRRSSPTRNAMNTGIIFGIALAFLVLIGFHSIAAALIAGMLRNQNAAPVGGLSIVMIDELVFFGLVGLWAGWMGAKPAPRDPYSSSILRGLISGGICGFLLAALVYIIGSMLASGVQLTTYLAAMVPDNTQLFLLGKDPAGAAIFYLLFFLILGAVGGLLARGLGRGSWRQSFSAWWKNQRENLNRQPLYKSLNQNRFTRYALYGFVILIVMLIPLVAGQYWNYTIGTVGIYVLLGLGLNIVVGLAGLLDLGYVAFFAIGAYTVALLTAPEPHHIMWSFWVTVPIAILLATSAGLLLGIPVLRMRGDYLAIVTLGFGEIIRILLTSDLLSGFTGGPRGVRAVAGPTLFGKPFNNDVDFVYLIILAVLLVIFVTRRLQQSRVGRAWIAMREDETVARAMGINTLKHKLLAFAIGAAFAGLGGVLFASRNQFTGPEDHNLMVSINVLCLVIVGGMGSIPGVIAGAFVLKGLPEVLRQLENYRVLFFGALLVVMMILRPEGLIPSRRRSLEMHDVGEEKTLSEAVASQPEAAPAPVQTISKEEANEP